MKKDVSKEKDFEQISGGGFGGCEITKTDKGYIISAENPGASVTIESVLWDLGLMETDIAKTCGAEYFKREDVKKYSTLGMYNDPNNKFLSTVTIPLEYGAQVEEFASHY